jgi:hypothetical protein
MYITFIRLAFFLLLTLIQIDKLGAYELKNDLQAIPFVGAAQIEMYLPLLVGKRVGLVVNQTSRVGEKQLMFILYLPLSMVFEEIMMQVPW